MKLPIEINKENGIPIYIQLTEQIRLLIHGGVLKPGGGMPTVRSLAVDLEINSNTVARVYRDLQNAGILKLKRGIGTFVAEGSATRTIHEKNFKAIEKKVRELITLSRREGIAPVELFQFIEVKWKEGKNEQE